MKVSTKSILSIFVLVFAFNLSYLNYLGFLSKKSDNYCSPNEKEMGSYCLESCCFFDENLFALTCEQYPKKNEYLKLIFVEQNLYFVTYFSIRNNSPPSFT